MSATEQFFKRKMLGQTSIGDVDTWANYGEPQWEVKIIKHLKLIQAETKVFESQVIGCLALSWTIVALTMVKGMQVHLTLTTVTNLPQSYGKVVYFITLFPYVVLTTFLIMGSQQVRHANKNKSHNTCLIY